MELQSSSLERMNEISSLDDLTISDKANSTGYPDYVYLNAATIFQNVHVEKPQDQRLVGYGTLTNLPMPVFEDEKSQRWSFELAFSALKYQDFLEDLMIDSCFYPSNPTHDDLTSLVVVMLYDFQDRKFQPRLCLADEEEIEEVREVEKSLNSFKTKIAASVARCRIKLDILTIDYLLPETVRKKQERASTLPLYAWVNTMKTSLEDVCSSLVRDGFVKVKSITELEGLTFCQDLHCQDLLGFPAHLRDDLCGMELFTDYKLVIQDKSRSLAAHSVKALMNLDDDVIIGSVASGLTIAHMSALTNQNTSKIFVCGVKSKSQQEQLQHFFTQMQCRNIKLIPDTFTDIDPTNPRLQTAKIVLLLPPCSVSGVSNPVDFILNENEDAGLLQDISRGSISEDKLNDLAKHQEQIMTHAVKFPKVQAVVYCTCSVYPEENEDVVKKALEYKLEGNKVQPYRLSPPVLPLCSILEIENASEKCFKLEPSETNNGCFVAVLTREQDPSGTVSVKDILARAAAKGLLDGTETTKPAKKERRKSKPAMQTTLVSSETQGRIAEFLKKESEEATDIAVRPYISSNSLFRESKANISIPPKGLSKAIPSMSRMSPVKKSLSRSSTTERHYEHCRSSAARPRLEEMYVLKPVELTLPPVIALSHSSYVCKSKSPPHLSYFHWKSRYSLPRNSLTQTSSTNMSKHNDTLQTSPAKHPRPWL
ncbi:putative methyltransferase NSUN7 isoform X1 [Acipenser oxyrinchus oxyrinchus]|uniref:Methyltransferase NSUN7 isoform X1 n=1 Tax=Acipenser oxyrinchus oxyrinchus TaxID=40147 RepID=A0AAD8GJN7_ACIOX|nr:putative methyltransferase NSUN7 isoform X1 [Acipenser oxyrinchus oxyrinchus]